MADCESSNSGPHVPLHAATSSGARNSSELILAWTFIVYSKKFFGVNLELTTDSNYKI